MQTKKMSLANIQGKLSRTEMKKIMAGSTGTICARQGTPCGDGGTCMAGDDYDGGSDQGCCCTDDKGNDDCDG